MPINFCDSLGNRGDEINFFWMKALETQKPFISKGFLKVVGLNLGALFTLGLFEYVLRFSAFRNKLFADDNFFHVCAAGKFEHEFEH